MKKRNVVILVVLLIVGFAAVSSTLIFNGTIGVGVNENDFDVIFVDAVLDGEESAKALISDDKKSITFESNKLTMVGDISKLDYEVKNNSTQYGADVTINCTTEESEYIRVTSEFDGRTLPITVPVEMSAQEVKSGFINAELIKAYIGDDDNISITCSIVAKATSTETSTEKNYYFLKFDSNGGTEVEDKKIYLNEKYGTLPVTEREGYSFNGWYTEDGAQISSDTVLDTAEDRIVYAGWVQLNNGGNSGPSMPSTP